MIASRAAALGWSDADAGRGRGRPLPRRRGGRDRAQRRTGPRAGSGVEVHRRRARRAGWCVVLGGATDPLAATEKMLAAFGDGPVVVGPAVPTLDEATAGGAGRGGRVPGRSGVAGRARARSPPTSCCRSGRWPATPRPGGSCARTCTARWLAAGGELLETLDAFFAAGGVLESAARALFVHPNTVRYRLERIGEITGFAPLTPTRRVHVADRPDDRPPRPSGTATAKRVTGYDSRRVTICRIPTKDWSGLVRVDTRADGRYARDSQVRARRPRSRPGLTEARLPDPVARPTRRRGPAALVVRAGRTRPAAPRHRADADEIKDTARTQPLLVAAALLAAEQLPLTDVAAGVAGHSVGELGAAAHRRGAHAGRRGHAGRGTRPGDGRRLRARTDRHGRGAGRRRGRGARRDRRRRAVPGQPQRRRPDRRRRRRSPGWRSSPPRRRPGPGSSRWPSRARSTPRTWRRPRRRWPRSPAASRPPTRTGSCCPTSTAPPSAAAPRCCAAWSPRSPRRCAGTCACRPWPTSASPPIIELPPAGTLAGLAKRALKGIEIVTLNTPDDLAGGPRPDRPPRAAPDPRADPAVPRRGRGDRRQLQPAPKIEEGAGHRGRHGHRPRSPPARAPSKWPRTPRAYSPSGSPTTMTRSRPGQPLARYRTPLEPP